MIHSKKCCFYFSLLFAYIASDKSVNDSLRNRLENVRKDILQKGRCLFDKLFFVITFTNLPILFVGIGCYILKNGMKTVSDFMNNRWKSGVK